MKELANPSNGDAVRQMASVVCKNLIGNISQSGTVTDMWVQLEPFFKDNMKQAILLSLACESSVVRSQIAALIATIAAIEIPRGEWTELISLLCQNTSNEQYHIKLASLQTLGYICEEIEPEHLAQELRTALISALTMSIDPAENQKTQGFAATKLATKALLTSLPFAK